MIVQAHTLQVLPRAAQYVRMSTEHQQYSTANQEAAISRYASEHGLEIVRSYVDAGKSGLKIAGRYALQQLITSIESRQADFTHILVYDVSRWGRFQDTDESAFYEYICRRAGITVHYCAEPFVNDGTISSNLLKALKRTMAGEFSRELSVKVFDGQCRLARLGFCPGAPAPYGLRRQLVDQNGKPKMILGSGEHKSIHTDRITLVPGPDEEVATVRRIFQLYIVERWTASKIAKLLNKEGIKHNNLEWHSFTIIRLLSNPRYAGMSTFNRTSFKLKQRKIRNSSENWVVRDGALQPIVSPEQFARAQEILKGRGARLTNEEMLDGLRRLLKREGVITSRLVDKAPDLPSSSSYFRRFGTLGGACSFIGYQRRNFSFVEERRQIRGLRVKVLEDVLRDLRCAGAEVEPDMTNHVLKINGEFTVSFMLAKCVKQRRKFCWNLRPRYPCMADVRIIGRMNSTNRYVLDYYIFSATGFWEHPTWFDHRNGLAQEVHRFDDLSVFIGIARRASFVEAS